MSSGSGRSIIFSDRMERIFVVPLEWSHIIEQHYNSVVSFINARTGKNLLTISSLMRKAYIKMYEIDAVNARSLRLGMVCLHDIMSKRLPIPQVDTRANSKTTRLTETVWEPKLGKYQRSWPNIHAITQPSPV